MTEQSQQNQPIDNGSPRQVQIKVSDEKVKGEYANMMQVMHTQEEFVMDFLSVFPPAGSLNSRVIVSPGHMKRIVAALTDNLAKYEAQFGVVKPSEAPTSNPIGFTDRE